MIRRHFGLMEEVAARLTGAMALGLGLPPTFFGAQRLPAAARRHRSACLLGLPRGLSLP